MKPIENKYPIFESNQVLTNEHLNQVRKYLDEQERLTRTNLIGIGIVCGLKIETELDESGIIKTIHLSKGCAVTSEGYLIVEPADVALVSYRDYKLPEDIDYQPFKDASKTQYALWELLTTPELNTTALNATPDFLKDKAVLLFLELKKENLRNCSPNNCDDKGAEVTVIVRRLLIEIESLKAIIAKANDLDPNLTSTDIETALMVHLSLPVLRLPRYDVLATDLATSESVLEAFQEIFSANKLVSNTKAVLDAAYQVFKPVIQAQYPSNPFDNFTVKFGFLEDPSIISSPYQVNFLQYYYDFFDDLLCAFDEFRQKGLDLMCSCCPPEGLFPRHLMLGLLSPDSANPEIYRHHFLASSASNGCEQHTQELIVLFQRMVEMITHFTNNQETNINQEIRITPSKRGDVPLSEKAIPYYYTQDGSPKLFEIWNFEKTRRKQANQNLSYHSDKYNPPAPAFITEPLRYDLEPYNFLRIEGHLGKNIQLVMKMLLAFKMKYRLPINIVALRTGIFNNDRLLWNLSSLENLAILYNTLKSQFICFLCKEVQYFYGLDATPSISPGSELHLPLLIKCAPNYKVKENTVGWWFEYYLSELMKERDIIISKIEINDLVGESRHTNWVTHIIFRVILHLSNTYEAISSELDQFDYINLERRYNDLVNFLTDMSMNREFNDDVRYNIKTSIKACHLDALKIIWEEYKRFKQLSLRGFLRKNPGIQHKAGVPLGGTFILVYHDTPQQTEPPLISRTGFDSIMALPDQNIFDKATKNAITEAVTTLKTREDYFNDPQLQFILTTFAEKIQIPEFSFAESSISEEIKNIIAKVVRRFEQGTVIADFFLPYRCYPEDFL